MASIRKRGNKWQARVSVKFAGSADKSFLSRADAEAWAKIIESEMVRGVFIKQDAAERTSLATALEKYEFEITPSKRGAEQEKHRIRVWKGDPLAKKPLAFLRGVDFAKWRDNRLKFVKPSTVRHDLEVISNLFNVARIEWGMDGLINPIEGIRLPTIRNARSRTFYSGEEAQLLAAIEPVQREGNGQWGKSCRSGYMKPLVQLALETAMRRGELLSLRWENIHIDNRVAFLPMTKNGDPRSIPLSCDAAKLLHSLGRKSNGLVFDGVTANAVKLGFTRALQRARRTYVENGGEDPRMLMDLHFHDLRHVAITRLAEKLPNLIELSAVTGHKSLAMLKRYYHVKPEVLARKLG